jgi:hypothetical protein
VFDFLVLLFLVPLVLLAPGIFFGSFALVATGSVGRRQRFGMGGGWHGVEMVVYNLEFVYSRRQTFEGRRYP